VVDIIHRELGIDPEQVTKKGGRSYILLGPSKDPIQRQATCCCSAETGGADEHKIEMRECEEVGGHAHGRV
jgi:hypothetical protein